MFCYIQPVLLDDQDCLVSLLFLLFLALLTLPEPLLRLFDLYFPSDQEDLKN